MGIDKGPQAAPGSPQVPRRTPLYDRHAALGARIIDFGGWAMPVQYSSILEEHRAVREGVGLFDVCHMGEVELSGPGALAVLERLFTNDTRGLSDGQARYTVMCYPDGGIVDDCIVYRRGPERYLVVVNAANTGKDIAWMRQEVARHEGVTFVDQSAETGLIAVQGPRAVELVSGLAGGGAEGLRALRSFTFAPAHVAGVDVLVARTGYTGEDGVEIFCPAADAARLWDALLSAKVPGTDLQPRPCGLGARDTLRLEACLSLYGNDIDETTTPYEANLGWVVKLDHPFIGREALEKQKAAGLSRRLVAFVMEGRGTARHGYSIYKEAEGGEPVGLVTSGSIGPTVGKNIGLGYVPVGLAEPGRTLQIDCRGKRVAATVVRSPFYKRPPKG